MTDQGRIEGRILVVDNYDSFVYNLVQYVGTTVSDVIVKRNDAIDLADIDDIDPDGVVISPGPGTPAAAGISIPLYSRHELPILGVCLGHQALCAAHGATVEHAPDVVHGKPSTIEHTGEGVFSGLPEQIRVGRYHSLAVARDELPVSLNESARTIDEERSILMGVEHETRPHFGVQFHPESILTGRVGDTDETDLTIGHQIIEQFCNIAVTY